MEGERIPQVDGLSDLRPIGHGGFGSVYSALQESVGRRVAVKVFSLTGNESRRMQREATALGSLSDIPHVVQVHHVTTTDDGRPAIVMALMERSLRGAASWADRDIDQSLNWLDQVADALDEAHRRGIVHRDIKPDNILLNSRHDAFMADFGLATILQMSTATTTAFALSPPYAPPERLTSDVDSGPAGDIYSLAACFYEVIWGVPPYGTAGQGGFYGLINRVVAGQLPCAPGMPTAVHAVLHAAMATDPAARPSTAGEFAAALSHSVDLVRSGAGARPSPPGRRTSQPVAAPPPSLQATPTRRTRAGILHSPLLRRLIAELGLDPNAIVGTGFGGRITRADVLDTADARYTPATGRTTHMPPSTAPRGRPGRWA